MREPSMIIHCSTEICITTGEKVCKLWVFQGKVTSKCVDVTYYIELK